MFFDVLPTLSKTSKFGEGISEGSQYRGGWDRRRFNSHLPVKLLCIRLECTFIGLIVQESVLTATSTNMSSTVLTMKGKQSVVKLPRSVTVCW